MSTLVLEAVPLAVEVLVEFLDDLGLVKKR
jgi:hypothetical protein